MTAVVSDSDRLLAEGVPVELIDGRTLRLRFDFRALKKVEDRLGSLSALTAAIARGTSARWFEAVHVAMAAGLEHAGVTYDELESLLDTRQSFAYRDAIDEALAQAFPRPDPSGKASVPTSDSPGETSTAQPATSEPAPISGP